MKGMLVIAFLALLSFSLAQALSCYSCSGSVNGACVTEGTLSKVTCSDTSQRCGTIKVSSGLFHMYTRYRCLSSGCNVNTPVDPNNGIGINTTCCDTDYCNSGPASARLSLLTAAGILSYWLLKMA
ncbi:prostate stem cell antigen-like [Ambystoma mexicanum]|uniref:prostate stem cell antigen-like n=1 Tax=Ambystoma mexicanum TaxID=8296 RepID=UPI0037E8EECE